MMLKKLIRLNADDLLLCGGVIGGAFLLLHIITAVAVRLSGEGSSLLLSGILLPIAAGVLILLVSASHAAVTFDQALRFGQTRRRALALFLGVAGFEALFTMGLAALLAWLERLFAPHFWLWLSGREYIVMDGIPPIPEPGWSAGEAALRARQLFLEDFTLDWWWLPLIALGCLGLGVIIGAMIQRFGGKGCWFLWALWMVFVIVFQFLPWKQYTIVDWLFPLLGIMTLGALIWSVWSLLHAVVKS